MELDKKKIMEKLKKAEADAIRLETQEVALYDKLKKDYNLSTIEEADGFLAKMNIKLEELEAKQKDLDNKIITIIKEYSLFEMESEYMS